MGRLALLMTVGTGTGDNKEKRIESLAHGILHSIYHNKHDYIVFFGSTESKATIEKVKELAEKENKLPEYEFVLINKIALFNELFEKIKKKIIELKEKGYDILIDYTSGTKTMSATAAIAGALYKTRLCYIDGERKKGVVIPGTEYVVHQNLFKYYNEEIFREIQIFFNNYSFNAAKKLLENVIAEDEKREYWKQMIEAYDLWDKFKHEESFAILRCIKGEKLNMNKEFLGRLVHEKNNYRKYIYLLVDLLNNAKRRIEETKYDDAVARLYRTIELIAQIELDKLDLIDKEKLRKDKTFVLDPEKLENMLDKKTMEKLIKYREEKDLTEGKIKIGLHKSYDLLSSIGHDLGKKFEEDKQLFDLLSKRNKSILAHGVESVEKKTAEKLLKKVQNFAEETFPEVKKLMKKAEFPKLEITEIK